MAAQQRPDHATLARFVERHQDAIAGLFGEVLALCARSGLAKVGVIAVDGTKVHANASRDENLDYKQLACGILEEAKAVDVAEDELRIWHLLQSAPPAPRNTAITINFLTVEEVDLAQAGVDGLALAGRQLLVVQPGPSFDAEEVRSRRTILQAAHQHRVNLVLDPRARPDQLRAAREAPTHCADTLIRSPDAVELYSAYAAGA